jgi:hypothetical protein
MRSPSTSIHEYDVFVSYRHRDPDEEWVQKRLVPALRERGVSVCIDTEAFRLGHPILREMERAVRESRFTVSVLTEAYESSGFTDIERVMAQHLDAEERKIRWLAIMREEVDLRLLDRFRLALDMTDDSAFDGNLERLVGAVLDLD